MRLQWIITSIVYFLSNSVSAQDSYPKIFERGFSPLSQNSATLPEPTPLKAFCTALKKKFKELRWKDNPCGTIQWKTYGYTKKGNPLIYFEYGRGEQVTLLLSGVHPDELTPIPMGFRLAQYISQERRTINTDKYRVIVAPLVNPDGFLIKRPTRVNSNGVDPNRNFFTKDWYDKALKSWARKKKHSKRHFPGFFPSTEPETQFQAFLVNSMKPDKIVSIHAPLGFLDYDGPGDRVKRPKSPSVRQAKRLASAISKKSNNYRVVDYSFYPGSLGNFAGNEKMIPTVTLELKTTNPKMVEAYWNQFLPGMLLSIKYPFERYGYTSGR